MNSFFTKSMELLEKKTNRIKHKEIWLVAIQICIICISLYVPVFKGGNSYSVIVGSCTLLSMLNIGIFICSDMYEKFGIKKAYRFLLTIIGISFIVNGVYFLVKAYIIIGIVFCGVVPLQNRVFFANSYSKMLKFTAFGVFISFGVFLIISLISGPALGVDQYMSVLVNPNLLGNYMIIVIAAGLYTLNYALKQSKRLSICCDIIIAAAIVIAIFSNSRSSMIAILLQLITVTVIFVLRNLVSRNIRGIIKIFKQGVILLLLTCILFFVLFYALTDVKINIIKSFPNIQITTEYDKITLKSMSSRMLARYQKGIDETKLGAGSDEKKNKDEDQFTSGRKEIWKQFFCHLSIKGHKEEGRQIIEKNRYYQNTNAHNVYIQTAYSAGIVAGIAMCFLMLLVAKDLIQRIYYLIKTGCYEDEIIFMICSAIGFAIVSLTSAGYMLYTYLPSTFFYLCLGTVSVYRKDAIQ